MRTSIADKVFGFKNCQRLGAASVIKLPHENLCTLCPKIILANTQTETRNYSNFNGACVYSSWWQLEFYLILKICQIKKQTYDGVRMLYRTKQYFTWTWMSQHYVTCRPASQPASRPVSQPTAEVFEEENQDASFEHNNSAKLRWALAAWNINRQQWETLAIGFWVMTSCSGYEGAAGLSPEWLVINKLPMGEITGSRLTKIRFPFDFSPVPRSYQAWYWTCFAVLSLWQLLELVLGMK